MIARGSVAAEPAAQVLASVGPAKMNDAFIVQLAHRWRGRDPEDDPVLAWLEQRLAALGTTADAVVHEQLQEQSAFSATVQNIIGSLHLLSGDGFHHPQSLSHRHRSLGAWIAAE
jgi:hypothetical protein